MHPNMLMTNEHQQINKIQNNPFMVPQTENFNGMAMTPIDQNMSSN